MGKTLLLADDSVTIQKVVGISFASEDIALITVDNGDDAIARARALRPDVILADVVMPGKSGYEVCEAIKSDPALRHIPVLLLTGTFEAFDTERANRAGAAGHIAKPFEAQALVERVKRLLAAAPAPAPPAPQPAAAPQAAAPRAASPQSGAPRPLAQPQAGAPQQAAAPRPLAAPQPAAPPPPLPPAARVQAPPAAPPRAPAPPPAAARTDEAFDFFDESVAEPAQNARTATAESQLAGPNLNFDGGEDSAFAFGDDDLSTARPTRSSAAAHTVAILPDAPIMPHESLDSLALETDPADAELELAPRPPVRAPAPVTPALDESERFDFEFGNTGPGDRDAALPTAAVLDPIAASDYDVSSSDLRAHVASDATRLIEPAAEPPVRVGDDPVMDLLEGDLDEGDVSLSTDPADVTYDRLPPASRAAQPRPMRPEPLELERARPAPASPVRAETPPARPHEHAPAAQQIPSPAAVLARVEPALRAQLHDTLEKIAWEAFGAAAESIVQQAVERIEKTAWEVVPRLAETLIQEEIRKLKGDSDGN